MAVFQVIFGLTVFALTRNHYRVESVATSPPLPANHPAGANLLNTNPESEFEQLMDLFPPDAAETDPAAMLVQADNHFAAGRYQQAAEGYSRLLQLNPGDADIYNNLGITLHYLGRSEEALGILDEGVTVDPLYQRIWLTRGFVNSQVGNLPQAREALIRARDLGPDSDVGRAAQQMLDQLPNR